MQIRFVPRANPSAASACNACGAPLQNGRCPRCGYNRQKEGQVVYSAFAGAAFPIQYTALGTATGAGKILTVPNISVKVGDTLFIHVAATGTDLIPSSAVWGSQVLTGISIGTGFTPAYILDAYVVTSTQATAQTLTVTNNNSDGDWTAVIIVSLNGSRSGDANTAVPGENSNRITAAPNSHVNNTLSFIGTFLESHAADIAGTWDAPVVPQQNGLIVGGAVGPGFFMHNTIELALANLPPATGPYGTVHKQLVSTTGWGVDSVTVK